MTSEDGMKSIELKCGTVQIHARNIFSIQVRKNYFIQSEDVGDVMDKIESIADSAYALISDRKHEYSTDVPKVYSLLSDRKRLKCFAIVAYRSNTEKIFNMEKSIEEAISKRVMPLELFDNIEAAVSWANIILSED